MLIPKFLVRFGAAESADWSLQGGAQKGSTGRRARAVLLHGQKRVHVEGGGGGSGSVPPTLRPGAVRRAKGAALLRITLPCNYLGMVREPPTLSRHNHNLPPLRPRPRLGRAPLVLTAPLLFG